MIDKINSLLKRVEEFRPKAEAEIEEFRVRMLGRKGEMNELFEEFKQVAPELKKELGQRINALKNTIAETITRYKTEMENRPEAAGAGIDMTRPGTADRIGSRHPISLVRNQIVDIFTRLGYTVAEGPEIEDDWHVFSALNFPPEHPARDMQDTFFISKSPDILLRTHTSSIQVRTMERSKPPIRVICPGRVFRNEAISYRAHCIFHQVEGLFIDENVSFADLKQSILYFAKEPMNNPHGNSHRFRIEADSMEPVSRQAHHILLTTRNKEQIPLSWQLFQPEAIILSEIPGI